jgi:hypothetical protein
VAAEKALAKCQSCHDWGSPAQWCGFAPDTASTFRSGRNKPGRRQDFRKNRATGGKCPVSIPLAPSRPLQGPPPDARGWPGVAGAFPSIALGHHFDFRRQRWCWREPTHGRGGLPCVRVELLCQRLHRVDERLDCRRNAGRRVGVVLQVEVEGRWQRFAGKWATGATGQKPFALVDITTVDFKGFFDSFQRMTENFSFGSVRNCPNGRSRQTWPEPPLPQWGVQPTHLNLSSGRGLPRAMMPKSLTYKTRI